MRVYEIFYSLQGEGIYNGVPMVFVRLQGCSLGCDYCDTAYAQDFYGGRLMDIEGIFRNVKALLPYQGSWVCITGGEPMEQSVELEDLVRKLSSEGYKVTIETNGTWRKPRWWTLVDSWNADIKCPSSRQCGKSLVDEWCNVRFGRDQVKFVVGDEEDLGYVLGILGSRVITGIVLVSPVIKDGVVGESWLKEVANFCLENRVRYSLQWHKVVGVK